MKAHRRSRDQAGASPVTATAIVVGSMIGTGVFTSLGFQVVAIESGFVILLLWTLGGLLALCGALCYAELSAALPRSGGEYHLLREIYHPLVGFLAGWISITVGFAAPVALAAIAFEKYMANAFTWLPAHGLAPGLVILATAVYLTRLEVGSRFLDFFTFIKALALLILAGALILFAPGEPTRFAPVASDLSLLAGAPFGISLVYVMYAYSGWNASTYIVNEVRDPQRSVPRSLIVGTLLVTILYVLINAAFLVSTPMELLKGKVEVGLIAAQHGFGTTGGQWVSLFIGLGLVSTVAALTWTGPRVAQMMGEDIIALRILGRTSRTGVPYVAILLQAIITLAMLLTSSFESIMVFMQFILILSSMLTVFGVIWLRIRRPELKRPFRVPLYPLTPLLFCGVSLLMLVYTLQARATESLLGLGVLAVGWGVYAVTRGPRHPVAGCQ